MNCWLDDVTNEFPKGLFYVYIQQGKAKWRSDASGFIETSMVLGFRNAAQAEYFIDHWDNSMHSYSQAVSDDTESFYVFLKTPKGYYADEIINRKE